VNPGLRGRFGGVHPGTARLDTGFGSRLEQVIEAMRDAGPQQRTGNTVPTVGGR